MGECANESIGIDIKGLRVLDKVSGEVSGGSMTLNHSEASARSLIASEEFNLGVSFTKKQKEEEGDD